MNKSEYRRWVNDKGDKTHRLNYNLNENSIVFDVGGYKGDWSKQIWDKYNCNIYVFEPVKKFYDQIVRRFSGNKKIKVFHQGLSNTTKKEKIYLNRDSSSTYNIPKDSIQEKHEDIFLVDILVFFGRIDNSVKKIDLIKINIEGEEFNLLEHLILNNMIMNINDIQVQFHDFVPKAEEKRDKLHKELAKTHYLTYNYKFVWENWRIK